MNLTEAARQIRLVFIVLWCGMLPFVCYLAFRREWAAATFVFVIISAMPFLMSNGIKVAKRHLKEK